jgi:hypothetical protein
MKSRPRFSMEEEKIKKIKSKNNLMEIKAQKKEEMKLDRETNRILKENFMILNDIILYNKIFYLIFI